MPSILDETKKSLGMDPDYTPFDADLILHINSVLSDLHQLGIGPDLGFEITGKDETWEQLLQSDPRLNNVKSYLYLKVRMLFDPPNVGYVLTAWEKLIAQAEWRINVAREEIAHPPTEVADDATVWTLATGEPFPPEAKEGDVGYDPATGDLWRYA